ncbi:uncharacterized protein N0V89_006034 [Didymosphaeria variabile]|uniref:Heterokaryon incompatibility domain-containing protein n=1 Tax=Didymosphaeria variabile TaxID=1932322 RepID=A0A9W8XPB2_9PLEO|nr:uncharacterized protein N0V89_006034 [Didymosphaeria variabile]KAJ4354300.1 hypothetical protein N0V89_006034 [Didymosphaeria variabile]
MDFSGLQRSKRLLWFLGEGQDLRYTPLEHGQIRLLAIRPGRSEDKVVTRLVTVPLSDSLPYEALSYTWGAWNDRGTLVIDGQTVDIHAGLFNAIHALRYENFERLIWADAICINQRDNEEKSHQIQIMDQIYATADNVVIYLGQVTEHSQQGIEALRSFIDLDVTLAQPPWLYVPPPQTEKCLADILMRPWFTRIWTVQESVLARYTTLVCGKHQVSWRGDFQTLKSIVFRFKAAAIAPHFGPDGNPSHLNWTPFLQTLEAQMRQAARREGAMIERTQLDLAFDFRHRRSTDPRDKYFAIFSIVENDRGGTLALASDYSKDVEELHRKFVTEMQRLSETI